MWDELNHPLEAFGVLQYDTPAMAKEEQGRYEIIGGEVIEVKQKEDENGGDGGGEESKRQLLMNREEEDDTSAAQEEKEGWRKELDGWGIQ